MKKIFAAVLCAMLALALCAGAMAETVTAQSGFFTYELPEGYIRLSPELAEALMTNPAAVEQLEQMGGEDAAAGIQQAMAMIDFSVLEVAYSGDMAGAVNMQAVDGNGMTNALMAMFVDNINLQMIENYIQLGFIADASQAETRGMVTVGDNMFYALRLNAFGQVVDLYVTMSEEGSLQTSITFTDIPEEDQLVVLNSFAYLVK